MNQLLRHSVAPAAALLVHQTLSTINQQEQTKSTKRISSYHDEGRDFFLGGVLPVITTKNVIRCDAPPPTPTPTITVDTMEQLNKNNESNTAPSTIGDDKEQEDEAEEWFHNLFPLRQLWKPKVEYPLWDEDWDGRKLELSKDYDDCDDKDRAKKEREMKRYVRKHGVTRHIILIRHGQYDETHKEDEKRILTPLGREQAALTGQRLAKLIQGYNEQFGPCNVTTLRVSDITRAKETAEIISQYLPSNVQRACPDEILNEGRPCHTIPTGYVSKRSIAQTDKGHDQIEKAFNKYFYRSDPPSFPKEESKIENVTATSITALNERELPDIATTTTTATTSEINDSETKHLQSHPQHEFEIIVCHANVIRYFLCRALQIPPEAWLRLCTFNCSLNYLVIRSTGSVSCRMIGDIGHLGYDHSTFSMHHGFNW